MLSDDGNGGKLYHKYELRDLGDEWFLLVESAARIIIPGRLGGWEFGTMGRQDMLKVAGSW